MSNSWILIMVGAALATFGLWLLSRGGGVLLKNFGINFGGSIHQNIRTGDIGPSKGGEGPKAADWIGLATAIIGLITALIGLVPLFVGAPKP